MRIFVSPTTHQGNEMPRLTKKQIARNERIQKVIIQIEAGMGTKYANALGMYALVKGSNWAKELILDWYRGSDENFKYEGEHIGGYLRSIRNSPTFGPMFYEACDD
jgi:hypothetical protein